MHTGDQTRPNFMATMCLQSLPYSRTILRQTTTVTEEKTKPNRGRWESLLVRLIGMLKPPGVD